MSELTLNLLRLGFLGLLWVFVLSVIGVLRRDIFGTQVAPKVSRRSESGSGVSGVPRTVVVTAGNLKGSTITLGQQTLSIGRSPDCTLVLDDDDFVSSKHAQLSPGKNGTWLIEDLGSTNGTFLNRARLTAPTPVEIGASIRIGRTVLELRR